MKTSVILPLLVLLLAGCTSDDYDQKLQTTDTLLFNGKFATAAYVGIISLQIQNGKYSCYTNWPNGYAAGYVRAESQGVVFTDTLPIPVQTPYGPSFVLYGPYAYMYDGNTLYLQRNYGGKIRYKMERQEQ